MKILLFSNWTKLSQNKSSFYLTDICSGSHDDAAFLEEIPHGPCLFGGDTVVSTRHTNIHAQMDKWLKLR